MGDAAVSTYLELVLEQVLLVGQLAVQAEEFGLVGRHFLHGLISHSTWRHGPLGLRYSPVTCSDVR
jgi:hypothetical protein